MTLQTSFAGVSCRSPVWVGSGPASHDVNQVHRAEEQGAGAVVLKTACSDKFAHMRFWPRPRYKLLDWDRQIAGRSKVFSLYSYEQGYSGTLEDYADLIRISKKNSHIPVIGSIFGGEAGEWSDLASMVQESGADAVELDISSPHKPGSLDFETTFLAAIRAAVSAVRIPVIVKLGPGPDVVHQCVAAEQSGASAVTLCNRLRGVDVDLENQAPILHGYYGGIGGPWARYYTMRHVAEAAQAVRIPISATGGVMTGEDVLKYVLLGASTVQILSVILVNGWQSIARIQREIETYMERKNIQSLEEIRGVALRKLTDPENIVRWSGEPLTGPRNEWK